MNRAKVVCVSVAFTLAIIGGLALAGIEGSKHDFSNEAWTEGDPCAACHLSKPAEPPKTPPLWDPRADLRRTFGAAARERTLPGQGTLICLRCHDGTVASERTAAAKERRITNLESPALFASGHKSSEHPVGVEYPQFDKGYRPFVAVAASGTVTLPDGKVECVSCHDPHGDSEQAHMLVAANERSALCLTCHRK